jgi:hypothetical protein
MPDLSSLPFGITYANSLATVLLILKSAATV